MRSIPPLADSYMKKSSDDDGLDHDTDTGRKARKR